jgi:4'-phosphopantetheinyl transferase
MTAGIGHPWTQGPLRPRLGEGAIHVWRADLTAAPDELGELLCVEERARAERFMSDRDGTLWRRSRGLLRVLLGRYLQREPRSLRFAIGEHGKPALIEDADGSSSAPIEDAGGSPVAQLGARASQPSFNMSHSGQFALYAFGDTGAVGVDIEVARRPIDEVAIAARTLGADTARRLQALEPEPRRQAFLRAWVRHEAEMKCLGVGIGSTEGIARHGHGPWIAELEMGPGAAGAVASERPTRELCCWDWRSG